MGISMKSFSFFVLGFALVLLWSCRSQKSSDYLAKVGNRYISVKEFKDAFEFNPYLNPRFPADSAKKVLLKTLVAEKMLAQEAAFSGRAKKRIADLVDEYRREALIEEFWNEVIMPKVKVSEKELKRAYHKSKVKKVVRYLLFTDASDAQKAAELLKQGLSFEELARTRGFTKETIPEDTITFTGRLPNIEDQVFKMKIGQISPPVKEGLYYFILKEVRMELDLFTSKMDYAQKRASLLKILHRRKAEEEFRNYLAQNVPSPPYRVAEPRFKDLVKKLEAFVFKQMGPASKDLLPDDLYYSFDQKNEAILKKSIVSFYDGSTWNVQTLLKRMMLAPYPIRFDNRRTFRESMLLSLRHVLDDEILVKQAIQHGLENSAYVNEQSKMWSDYLEYKKGLARALHNKDLSDVKAIYAYLNTIKHKYPVQVNYAILDTLKLTPTGMAVLKQHFPGRLAVPVLPLLPDWHWE
jgi:hypothetical protein